MTPFLLCSISVLQGLSRPNLSLFFDLAGSNYSKVDFLYSISLLRVPHTHPSTHSSALFSYCPCPPSWLWYPEFPAKTTVCQRITFLWSRRQSLVFLSWTRALTPDLQWLLPWRSQAEITVNAGLWYLLENRRWSPKVNTVMPLSVHILSQIPRQGAIWQRPRKWVWLPDQSCTTMILECHWIQVREMLWLMKIYILNTALGVSLR